MTRRPLPPMRPGEQRGAFGVLYAIVLPVMLGMIGLAVDLGMMYARGHELQSVADGAALAAARALDGTTDGITAARNNARGTAIQAQFRFLNSETFSWSATALSFGPSADGPWTAADAITPADAPLMFFARVDTSGLDAMYGRVSVAFLRVVGVEGEQHLVRRAVAGRKDSALGPLAVCALNNTEITMRTNAPSTGVDEAVEYGFRRGVTYNLLNLNPNGTTPRNFAINPVDFAPAPDLASHHTDEALRPFACSGKIPAPPLAGGAQIYVREPFPASLIGELNSRFGDYTGGSACTRFGSPPDVNIIDYRGAYSSFWMSGTTLPVRASADQLITGGKLVTVADGAIVPAGTTSASYGTLWSFGRPMRYNAATGGMGALFNKSDWAKLYPVTSGLPLASNYSASQLPYERNLPPHRLLPSPLSGEASRRVLNVPLLQCPFAGSTATVLGIGRFLMTTPATSSPLGVHAEFGGLTTYGALAANAVLYK
jgi:type II secretory pathway pseudopilin PulG